MKVHNIKFEAEVNRGRLTRFRIFRGRVKYETTLSKILI